jgi:hypothetical protein
MEFDNEALETKRKEIEGFARQAISRFSWAQSSTADSAVQAFARLTPPTKPEMVIHMITMQSFGRGGGRSQKPGNIYLNWRKLIDVAPDVTIAAAGALASPYWLLPLIGLYIWNKLWRGAEEELSEVEATTIYALWKNRNGDNKISEDDGYARTNSIRNQQGMPALSRSEYSAAISRLLQMECIEIEEGMIWLREWVRIAY